MTGTPPGSLHHGRSTPFEADCSLFVDRTHAALAPNAQLDAATPALVLPATYATLLPAALPTQRGGGPRQLPGIARVDGDAGALARFFAAELDVSRLNLIHRHLWLAGLERPARPLHQQLAIGRRVCLTESADLHLLWGGSTIWIKPLPDFLSCASIWTAVLNGDRELHERACGLLLSYLWLVGHRSDLRIAHETGLLPTSVDWPRWTRFARSVATRLDTRTLHGINVRYRHSELRLNRINLITRCCSLTRSPTTLVLGYMSGFYHYQSFVGSSLAWLVSAIVYITVVLTAMQVGLATDLLSGSDAFQRVSYGFAVFSILGPVVAVAAVVLVTASLVVSNYRFTLRQAVDWTGVPAMSYAHMLDDTPTPPPSPTTTTKDERRRVGPV